MTVHELWFKHREFSIKFCRYRNPRGNIGLVGGVGKEEEEAKRNCHEAIDVAHPRHLHLFVIDFSLV
jgi:hypothetical protein